MRRLEIKCFPPLANARGSVALALCCILPASSLWAQQQAIAPIKPTAPVIVRPYLPAYVPPTRLGNSMRLRDLIRGGNLYLTVQDAIALALENNIDIEINRYTAFTDQWNLERLSAGGALPGVPSGFTQAASVVSGQGVAGTQAAAGVSTSNRATSSTNAVGATISQIGPTTPTLDPVIQQTDAFSHLSAPQSLLSQAEVENLISNKRNYSTTISQGIETGGTVSLSYTDSYLSENSPTDILNPSTATQLSLSFRHNLLRGRGAAVLTRNITVAKNDLEMNDLNFQTQVITTVVNVLNQYYSLVADYQDLSAKRGALDVANKLYQDNKQQVAIGTMTPLDVTTAEAQVATSEQDLSTSQGTLEQQEVSLKNLLSRDGLADPLIREAQVIPLDTITVPEHEDIPPLQQLIETAYAKRADLAADRMNVENAKISALGTANGVQPRLAVLANASMQGLAGTKQYRVVSSGQVSSGAGGAIPPGYVACPTGKGPPGSICEVPDPFLIGGLGTALGQMIRRDYPSQSLGGYLNPVVRNQTAEADYAIDQLSERQEEVQNAKRVNQVAVDVSNQVVTLEQARVRYAAAVKNRELQQQLLSAEQKKFALGASTTFLVVQQQRDLSTAQATEIADLAAYSQARVGLDQALGTTLEVNHVAMQDAANGQVPRPSTLPATLPSEPKLPPQ